MTIDEIKNGSRLKKRALRSLHFMFWGEISKYLPIMKQSVSECVLQTSARTPSNLIMEIFPHLIEMQLISYL